MCFPWYACIVQHTGSSISIHFSFTTTGDTLVDVTVIDDGWMEGRVERTGQYGMLPSNYVEKQ